MTDEKTNGEARTVEIRVNALPELRGREGLERALFAVEGLGRMVQAVLEDDEAARELRGAASCCLVEDLAAIAQAAEELLVNGASQVALVPERDLPGDGDFGCASDLVRLLGVSLGADNDGPRETARRLIAQRLTEGLQRRENEARAGGFNGDDPLEAHLPEFLGRLREKIGEDGVVSLVTDFDPQDVRILLGAFAMRPNEDREDVRRSLFGSGGLA